MLPTNARSEGNGSPHRPEKGSDEVYRRLRLAILTGTLRPNMPMIEADLAASLGTSRTPVRESLQRLAADGLIVPRRRGWAVREYTLGEIQENYEVRAALEGYAARLASQRGTQAQIDALARIHAEREAMRAPDDAARVDSNRRFHDAIIAAAGNGRLAESIFRVGQFYFNVDIARMTSAEEILANVADHARIVAALRNRDAAGAEDAMREHIMRTFGVFRRVNGLS